jgi:ADP-ribose pyrophosphatase YjhB (NUDIX family)
MDLKHQIYDLFTKSSRLRFSEIRTSLGVRSNILSYHLNRLVKDGLLEKDEDDYILSVKGEQKIPFFTQFSAQTHGAIPVVIVAIVKNKEILLLRRNKRPYQGYWGMPGGALIIHETIEENALSRAKKETNLDCEFQKISAVVHERVMEKGVVKHAFVLFLVVVKPKKGEIKESDEGKLEWFSLKSLRPDRVIPSDFFLLKKYLGKKSDVMSVVLEDKDGKLSLVK